MATHHTAPYRGGGKDLGPKLNLLPKFSSFSMAPSYAKDQAIQCNKCEDKANPRCQRHLEKSHSTSNLF